MKKTLVLMTLLLAFAALAVDMIVPKTDDRTILRQPLDEGRIAYQELDDGNASLLIGKKGDPHPYSVVDPLTLRGYRITYIPESEYAVSYTAGFSYAGADNKYVLNNTLNVTNRLVFTALGNRKITNFDAYEKNLYSGGIGDTKCCNVTREISDKQVIVTVVRTMAGTYYLQDPILYGEQNGSDFEATDLVNDLHIKVIDSMGTDDLSNWRNWAKHSNDGNLGEDWYKYPANGKVVINSIDQQVTNRYSDVNHGISFNGVNALANYYKLFYDRASTNLVLKAGRYYPIEFQARGMGAPTDFKFTKIISPTYEGTTNVELEVQAPDPNYSINLVSIYYVDSLTHTNASGVIQWQLLPAAKITKSGMHFKCNMTGLPGAHSAQFFKFVYGGVDMATCITYLRENVLVEDDMQINGNLGVVNSITLSNTGLLTILKPGGLRVVGDDAKVWSLHVSGGTATWVEVP